MNGHASLNKIYRLIWNSFKQTWVAVSEIARRGGKRPGGGAVLALLAAGSMAHASPLGGAVSAGSGTISQTGAVTTINQSSQNLSVNWQSFNVGSGQTVDFVQPGASSVAVNHILAPSPSQIDGHLQANGQVYLINPNGIFFGSGASANVGGLVASTLDLEGNPAGTQRVFGGAGNGSVINQGHLTAQSGGYISLLGNEVQNQGTLSAQLGTVALGAGNQVTLTFAGNQLMHLVVDQSVLNSVAANHGLIQADGGQVTMAAGAMNSVLASVVNNGGVVEAQTLSNQGGHIVLLGGKTVGQVIQTGTLDASAPQGGNGGSIETSAQRVTIGNGAVITTQAPQGVAGSWLIDPTDFTIGATAAGTVNGTGTPSGDISGTTLSNALNLSNVTIQSSQGSTAAGTGNITVNDAVSWNRNLLTLTAANDIVVNNAMSATGTAALDLNPATANGTAPAVPSGTIVMGLNQNGFIGHIDYSATGPLNINGIPYTVINNLGQLSDATTAPATPTLQGIAASNLAGHYVLGSNIDATPTGAPSWTGTGGGFIPIGKVISPFTGVFDGFGHGITGLTINSLDTSATGLFGFTTGASIRNVGLVNASIHGGGYGGVGALIGMANGDNVSSTYSTGSVTGSRNSTAVGGLIGSNVSGLDDSVNPGASISNSFSTATVTNQGNQTTKVGGLVGYDYGASIINSHANGAVIANQNAGGLVGSATSSASINVPCGSATSVCIQNSYATGTVSTPLAAGQFQYGSALGGLVGADSGVSIERSFAIGAVTAGTSTGSHSTTNNIGGLVGYFSGSTSSPGGSTDVTNSYSLGNVTVTNAGTGSSARAVGGLIGSAVGTTALTSISNSYSAGTVSVSATTVSNVGGFLGGDTNVTLANNFYDKTPNPSLSGLGGVADGAGQLYGLATADFLNHANFSSATIANGNVNPGWDFNTVWTQFPGQTAPLLQAFMIPVNYGSVPIVKTYDGKSTAGVYTVQYTGLQDLNLAYDSLPQYGLTLLTTPPVQGAAVFTPPTSAINASPTPYTVTASGLYSDQLGYQFTPVMGSLTINPAPLTVTAGSVPPQNPFIQTSFQSAVSVVEGTQAGGPHPFGSGRSILNGRLLYLDGNSGAGGTNPSGLDAAGLPVRDSLNPQTGVVEGGVDLWDRLTKTQWRVGDTVVVMITGNDLTMQMVKHMPAIPVASPASFTSKPVPSAPVVLSADALFDFDKSVLKPEGRKELIAILKGTVFEDGKGTVRSVHIDGYTDWVGTDAYNDALSDRRANAVREFFISLGVPAEILVATGHGKRDPVMSNQTDEGRAGNRRAEITIFH